MTFRFGSLLSRNKVAGYSVAEAAADSLPSLLESDFSSKCLTARDGGKTKEAVRKQLFSVIRMYA